MTQAMSQATVEISVGLVHGAAALLVEGAVVDTFTSRAARRPGWWPTVMPSCSPAAACPSRRSRDGTSGRALYACDVRWLAMLDQIGRVLEANHLRPFAPAAQSALAVAGLA